MRVFRIVLGLALVITGFIKKDTITGAFGLLFSYQGIFNVSTCGVGGCYTNTCQPVPKQMQDQAERDVHAEEIQ